MKAPNALPLLVLACTTVALIGGESRQWGRRVAGDRLLDRAIVVNNSLPVPVKSTVYRYLPPSGSTARLPNITAISVQDSVPGGRGGHASLVSGGLNRTSVSIKLTSQPYQRFNFTVQIYGK